MAPSEKTTLYLDHEVKVRLQKRADRHRQSMSGAANILLAAALDHEESTHPAVDATTPTEKEPR